MNRLLGLRKIGTVAMDWIEVSLEGIEPSLLSRGNDSFEEIFTFSVTVDNFNEFAAKAEKLSVISLKEQTVVISCDDLLVYGYFFIIDFKAYSSLFGITRRFIPNNILILFGIIVIICVEDYSEVFYG